MNKNKIVLRVYDKPPLFQEEDGVGFCLDNFFLFNDAFCIKSCEYEKHYAGLKEYTFSKRSLISWCYDKKNYPDNIYIKYMPDGQAYKRSCLTVVRYMNLNYSFEAILFMLKMIFREEEIKNKFEVFTLNDKLNAY